MGVFLAETFFDTRYRISERREELNFFGRKLTIYE